MFFISWLYSSSYYYSQNPFSIQYTQPFNISMARIQSYSIKYTACRSRAVCLMYFTYFFTFFIFPTQNYYCFQNFARPSFYFYRKSFGNKVFFFLLSLARKHPASSSIYMYFLFYCFFLYLILSFQMTCRHETVKLIKVYF